MTSNKRFPRRGFTLVELMVVVAMIALIMAALVTSLERARERARIQKATSDVKTITQAILAYENYNRDHELPTLSDAEVDRSTCGFILGNGAAVESGQVPSIIMAALSAGGKMRDPWGVPYRVKIKPSDVSIIIESGTGSLQTGFWYPNFYHLSAEERK